MIIGSVFIMSLAMSGEGDVTVTPKLYNGITAGIVAFVLALVGFVVFIGMFRVRLGVPTVPRGGVRRQIRLRNVVGWRGRASIPASSRGLCRDSAPGRSRICG